MSPDKQSCSHASHSSTDRPACEREHSHVSHRMAPPQHPHPRPFVASSMRGTASGAGAPGSGEGGMGALLGRASQLRPPRVSFVFKSA